ncbi:hypothetical protein FAI41_06345 [Acetobacteraceae bacterium]|nr:hypothetical protein FAI41_06345 [Acetobacteraceae bacterium]
MTTPILYFLHGWGYSKDFWQKTASHLSEHHIILADAGYFAEKTVQLPQSNYIVIGHSLGFMRLLPKIEADKNSLGILGINAFACFVQKEDFKEGISPRILALMQRNLSRNPEKTLCDFYKMCGDSKESRPQKRLDLPSLQQGLEILAQEDQRETFKKLEKTSKILSMLSGKDDPLAPAKKHWLTEQTNISGGHLLPLTHPEFCATWIKKHLKLLKSS